MELDRALRQLEALPERPRVLVVDNGSSDGTAAHVAATFPGVGLLTPGRNLGAAGRNLGVLATRCPYVAFCDDDTAWGPGSLARAVAVLEAHPRLAVVTARILVEDPAAGSPAQEDPICADLAGAPLPRSPDAPGAPLVSFLAGASVVRRSAFVAAGGFEPRLVVGGEEELLAADLLAAGWALAYVPELTVRHRASWRRDPHLRRRQGIRNALWFLWLRRPLPAAWRQSIAIVRSLPRDATSAGALAEALGGLGWVVRARRVVPAEVEALYRRMDEVRYASGARRYVS